MGLFKIKISKVTFVVCPIKSLKIVQSSRKVGQTYTHGKWDQSKVMQLWVPRGIHESSATVFVSCFIFVGIQFYLSVATIFVFN